MILLPLIGCTYSSPVTTTKTTTPTPPTTSPTGPPPPPEPTGLTGDTGGIEIETFGDCTDPGTAPAVSVREVPVTRADWAGAAVAGVFQDQAALDAWSATSFVEVDASGVDFATEDLVVTGISGSCTAMTPTATAADVGGATHVTLQWSDPSFGCKTLCSSFVTFGAAYAVPRGSLPTSWCIVHGGGCGVGL